MLKDIEQEKAEGVAVAMCREMNEEGGEELNVYLLNLGKTPIDGVLVTSSGYGELKGKKVKTSDLRYFLDMIPAESYRKIEPLTDDLLTLSNQYWVSFYREKKIFDRKFIFLPESVNLRHQIDIPLIKQKGIMIS
jgi:hypothetical protein